MIKLGYWGVMIAAGALLATTAGARLTLLIDRVYYLGEIWGSYFQAVDVTPQSRIVFRSSQENFSTAKWDDMIQFWMGLPFIRRRFFIFVISNSLCLCPNRCHLSHAKTNCCSLLDHISVGQSVSVVGVSNMGKSDLLRDLCRPEVRALSASRFSGPDAALLC